MEVHEQTFAYYSKNSSNLAAAYNQISPSYLKYVLSLVPEHSKILDAGCGSGRDAVFLANAGFTVSACDPVDKMLEEAKGLDIKNSVDFFCSDLEALYKHDTKFKAVLCSAVLQHVQDARLVSALCGLVQVVDENGLLFISVPDLYPIDDEINQLDNYGRLFIRRPVEQYIFFLQRLGFSLLMNKKSDDGLQRNGVSWTFLVFSRMQSGANHPVHAIESIIQNDRKINTYKYALLRSLVDLAVERPNIAVFKYSNKVGIPISEIASKWLEYYWPIAEYSLDHKPILQGQLILDKQDITFRKELEDLTREYSKIGGYTAFRYDMGNNKLQANILQKVNLVLKKIEAGIKQPVQYSGNAKTSGKIFSYEKGFVIVPFDYWTEFALLGQWISDSIVLRWAEFTKNLKNQNPDILNQKGIKQSTVNIIELLLSSLDPERDTNMMRKLFNKKLHENSLTCIWTAKQLKNESDYDVDHVLPFSLWRNNDIWNLMPADTNVNKNKSDKLPTRSLLLDSKPRIMENWQMIFENNKGLFLHQASSFTGNSVIDFTQDERENLFSVLSDSIELSAIRRNIPRWNGMS